MSQAKTSHYPEVKWAQRMDKVYITTQLPNSKNADVKLEPEGKLAFSATTGPENAPFEFDFDLFDKVNVEASKTNVGLRDIFCAIEKAEKGWWNLRLLKGEGKTPQYIKVNFGGMDFSGMGGMGGLGGLGGLGGMGGDEPDNDDKDQDTLKEYSSPIEVSKSESVAEEPAKTMSIQDIYKKTQQLNYSLMTTIMKTNDPQTYDEAKGKHEWEQAMQNEYDSSLKNKT